VLVNLIGNAVKFTDSGEVSVAVGARHVSAHTYELHFAVRDTGIGIPADRLDRLFKSFSQADSSTTRRYGGTGLGLAISKHLCELMGGRMWVESEPGRGSTFHFTVAAEAHAEGVQSYLVCEQPQLSGKRLLLVDDNETQRMIVGRYAEAWGLCAAIAGSAGEALALLHEGEHFDAAVLDVQMPGTDGPTLARELRRLPQYEGLPLIFLSAVGWSGPGVLSGVVGPCAFLSKPLRPSHLYDALLGVFTGQPGRVQHLSRKGEIDRRLGQRLPLRILLADDNVVNQQVATSILQRMGYRADVAANGLEVLDALRRQRYDILLTDVHMPMMDGLEAARAIRAEWAEEERPRVIAMTASAMQGDREMCLEAGMDDYISKPVRVEELQAMLLRWGGGAARPAEQAGEGGESISEAAEPRPEGAPVDRAVLLELRDMQEEGDEDVVGRIIELFLRETPARLLALSQAVGRGDAQGCQREAHTLKGSCSSVGAWQMAALCAEVEDAARRGVLECELLRGGLAAEYEKVRQALEALAGEGQPAVA
jgi:CheY-like chemotaxis protein